MTHRPQPIPSEADRLSLHRSLSGYPNMDSRWSRAGYPVSAQSLHPRGVLPLDSSGQPISLLLSSRLLHTMRPIHSGTHRRIGSFCNASVRGLGRVFPEEAGERKALMSDIEVLDARMQVVIGGSPSGLLYGERERETEGESKGWSLPNMGPRTSTILLALTHPRALPPFRAPKALTVSVTQ
ncbi:hypothetical protein KIPB_011462, partial [Kipferlia bialata]|eukprot:g11462.t1